MEAKRIDLFENSEENLQYVVNGTSAIKVQTEVQPGVRPQKEPLKRQKPKIAPSKRRALSFAKRMVLSTVIGATSLAIITIGVLGAMLLSANAANQAVVRENAAIQAEIDRLNAEADAAVVTNDVENFIEEHNMVKQPSLVN